MSARKDDLGRIQEIYDTVAKTLEQIEGSGFSHDRFVRPETIEDDLMAEGLLNRVFRVSEEGGALSGAFERYGFPLHEMSGMRNILAHAYGEIDREIAWKVIEVDFPDLLCACERYCEDAGVSLMVSWR